MSDPRDVIPRPAIQSILGIDRCVVVLGRAIWLYLALLAAASDRGLVIRTRMRVARDLAASEADIDAWLERLVRAGLVVRRTPSPYLVLVLPSWSGSVERTGSIPPESTANSAPSREEVPVSGNSHSSAEAIAVENVSGDRGLGEGATLVCELESLLGPSARDELAAILRSHPRDRVARALARVKRTPDAKIRKSRLALFRYLLVHDSAHAHVQP